MGLSGEAMGRLRRKLRFVGHDFFSIFRFTRVRSANDTLKEHQIQWMHGPLQTPEVQGLVEGGNRTKYKVIDKA